jgi:hypothetical protein
VERVARNKLVRRIRKTARSSQNVIYDELGLPRVRHRAA